MGDANSSSLESVVDEYVRSNKSRSSEPISAFIFMGKTGAGKSSMIKLLGGKDRDGVEPDVDGGLESCTAMPKIYEAEIDNNMVLLLDTPGFDDSEQSNLNILREIVSNLYLFALKQTEVQVRGVIFLHDITETRLSGSQRTTWNILKAICGKDAMKNVLAGTTQWSPEGDKRFQGQVIREKELYDTHWGGIYKSSRVGYEDRDNALGIIRDLLTRPPVLLLVQNEMLTPPHTVEKTTAGRVAMPAAVVEMERLRKEMEEQQRKNLEETKRLEEEHQKDQEAQKRAQDEERLRQDEEARVQAEKQLQEQREREEVRQREEQEKRKQHEEELKKQAEEAERLAEAERRAEAEERARKQEAARKQEEEEQRKRDEAREREVQEQIRRHKEEEERQAEEARKRAEAQEAQRRAEMEAQARRIEAARKKAEDEQREREEARRREEQEQIRRHEEELKRVAEEARRQVELARLKAEEDARRRHEEELRRMEEERQRFEEEQRHRIAEAMRQEEERQRQWAAEVARNREAARLEQERIQREINEANERVRRQQQDDDVFCCIA